MPHKVYFKRSLSWHSCIWSSNIWLLVLFKLEINVQFHITARKRFSSPYPLSAKVVIQIRALLVTVQVERSSSPITSSCCSCGILQVNSVIRFTPSNVGPPSWPQLSWLWIDLVMQSEASHIPWRGAFLLFVSVISISWSKKWPKKNQELCFVAQCPQNCSQQHLTGAVCNKNIHYTLFGE